MKFYAVQRSYTERSCPVLLIWDEKQIKFLTAMTGHVRSAGATLFYSVRQARAFIKREVYSGKSWGHNTRVVPLHIAKGAR